MARTTMGIISPISGTVGYNYGTSKYAVQTPDGEIYHFFIGSTRDLGFKKSTNGITWSAETPVYTGSANAIGIWYDKWSGLSSGLIHIVWTDDVNDDVFYRSIDTENSDALSTQTTVFLGVSVAGAGHISIARAMGGDLYCRVRIDSGTEGGFFKLSDGDVPNGAWASMTFNEGASYDQGIMTPGFAADNQDVMCMFWDASANEISKYIYDASADSWSETTIASSMTDVLISSASPDYAVSVDLINSKIILVAWSNYKTVGSNLRCWIIDETTTTETTSIITNSSGNQGLVALCIDSQTRYWHVFYGGNSDGSESVVTDFNLYCKISQDSGTTWGDEFKMSSTPGRTVWIGTCPYLYKSEPFVSRHRHYSVVASGLHVEEVSTLLVHPKTNYIAGILK